MKASLRTENALNPYLLDAGAELRAGSTRKLPQAAHYAWGQADTWQVTADTRHESWRRHEHICGVGELTVLVNGKWEGRGRGG